MPASLSPVDLARALDRADADRERYEPEFRRALDEIKIETGCEFREWGRGRHHGWCWLNQKHNRGYSRNYASRTEAVEALLSGEIEWIR